MITLFRKLFNSKLGTAFALAFVVLVALSFAGGDIANIGSNTGLGSSSSVATVGKEKIEAATLVQSANTALERARQQDPRATMKQLIAQGGLDDLLAELIDRTALMGYGKAHGVVAGDRLIDSEIAQIPAFKGVDDKFSQDTFRQALAQRGLSEQNLRDDLAQGLVARQLLVPASFGAVMPADLAKRYVAMLDETRKGTAIGLPSVLFMPTTPPSDAKLMAYYKAHTQNFIRPERRRIRYALINAESVKGAPPTEAEIAGRYKANASIYAAKEERALVQLIVPSKAAADAVVAEVQGGKSLETAAREKGLVAAQIGPIAKEAYAVQASDAVANAVFATPEGKIAPVTKGKLGWAVVRVAKINQIQGKTLDQARPEIVQALTTEKKRKAFADYAARIESLLDDGASLADVARQVNADVKVTEPVTADGAIYLKPTEALPDTVKPAVATAFSMEKEKPQIAETIPGETLTLYDVTEITPSAPAPFKEIRPDILSAYMLDTGAAAAKVAALQIQKAIRAGKSVEQAMAATGRKLPPPEQVATNRQALTQALQQNRQIPPPVGLMFRMAKGTVKVQGLSGNRGWFVVMLNEVVPGKVGDAATIAAAQKELGGQLGEAYAAALTSAARKELGVTRNAAAIKAVRDQLGGTGASDGN